MKKRVAWIDVAKGLAMFLVVLGHNYMSEELLPIVYCLNVPIFFLISGYTFKVHKYQSFWQLIKKIFLHLIIPYLVMNIISFIVFFTLEGTMPSAEDTAAFFKGVLYGIGKYDVLMYNIPLWFLPCISIIQCMYYFIFKYTKKFRAVIIVGCAVLGHFMSAIVKFPLAWSADIALTGIVFFAVGNWMRRKKVYKTMFKFNPFLGFIIMMALNVVFNLLNAGCLKPTQQMVDIKSMVFGNFFLFYICTLSGCMAIIYLAKILQGFKPLAYMGRNTIWILGMHSVFTQIYVVKLKWDTLFPSEALAGLAMTILEIVSVLAIKIIYDLVEGFAREKLYEGIEADSV